MLVAQRARGLKQRHGVQVEHRQRLRVVTRLHAVPGEAQDVAHPHRRPAQDVALDGDAVLVAAGDLHHRGVTDAREQGAHGKAGHVAVGAAAIGGVDGIDVAIEDARAAIDVLGVGGVRRCQFAGDRELIRRAARAPGAPGRCAPAGSAAGSPGPARPRISRQLRGALAHHAQPRGASLQPPVNRPPAPALSASGPPGMRAAPATACVQTHFISGFTSQLPFARTPPHGPLRRFFGQFIGQDMPVELKMHWPHMRQSNSSPLTWRSMAATGRSRRW